MASQQDFASSTVMTAATQPLGPFDIQTNGFLRYLEMLVTGTAAGNSASAAFNTGTLDAPFNALQQLTLQDPSSEYIVNPYAGYELFLANKYMGIYEPAACDPRSDPNFSMTTGTGGTGGSFSFLLRVPLEDRVRDAFAAVPNSAANKNYRLTPMLAPSSSVYATAPTNEPTVAIACTNFYWTEPPASIGGSPTVPTPNGNGSVAYLDREVFTALTGQTNPTTIFKNVGRVYKNAVFVLRSNASPSVRDSTDWPNPLSIWVNGYPLYYKPQPTWHSEMERFYGLGRGSLDTAGNQDTGVYTWHDLMIQTGKVTNWGPADQFLPTVASTKVQLVGAWGASASTLTVLQRTIKPVSGAALYS
jgi:hypothetical protein